MRIDELNDTPEKKTLYLSRKVLNGTEIMEWAKSQGFTSLLDPNDMHITIAYSNEPLDWEELGDSFDSITVKKPDTRSIQLFDGGAVVLTVENADLGRRWQQVIDCGGTWGYPDYSAHVTLTYGGLADLIIEDIKPFNGDIKLGPEIFSKVNKGWKSKTKEKNLDTDKPEDDLPEFYWFHPDGDKYLECENHGEYVAKHARKMKLDVEDIADIVNQDGDDEVSSIEAEELCDYALDNGWVMGTKSRIRAANVSSLRSATAYFTEQWPGRNAVLNVRDKFDVSATPEDIMLFTQDGMLPEAAHDGGHLPVKFWLVFDIPMKSYNESDVTRHQQIIQDVKNGRLHGVKGISDTREIVTQWLHVARNAALVMDAHAVAEANKLRRIEYADPELLCANQMAMIYRLFDKMDNRFGHIGLMQNIMQYMVRSMRDIDYNFHHQMSYYGFESRVADRYWKAIEEGKTPSINSISDLTEFVYSACREEASAGGTWRGHLAKEFEDLDKNHVERALREAVIIIGRMYQEEGEWEVLNDPFVVPADTVLLILYDEEISKRYDEITAQADIFQSVHKFRLEQHEALTELLKDGMLQSRYAVRLVDSQKFSKVRSNVSDRRSKKRRGD